MSLVDWMTDAACADSDLPSSAWTDRRGQTMWGSNAEHRAAIKVCNKCPVARDCLEYVLAIEANEGRSGRSGIYAGTTPQQRIRIQHQRDTGRKPRSQRLTAEVVREIRRRAAAGARHLDIALDMGVTRTNVTKIVNRVTWREIA